MNLQFGLVILAAVIAGIIWMAALPRARLVPRRGKAGDTSSDAATPTPPRGSDDTAGDSGSGLDGGSSGGGDGGGGGGGD